MAVKTGTRKLDFEGDRVLPDKMTRFLNIDTCGDFAETIEYKGERYVSLTELNDGGVSFKAIAKIIREQLAAGNFTKP